jgi:hypothetical protein
MSSVEFASNPGGEAAFVRANRFILAEDSPDTPEDVPGNAQYAGYFAEQCSRWGWPVTFPEPTVKNGQLLYPVIRFGVNGRDGTIIYVIEGWQPSEFRSLALGIEPETPAEPSAEPEAETPEVITPAPSLKRGKPRDSDEAPPFA